MFILPLPPFSKLTVVKVFSKLKLNLQIFLLCLLALLPTDVIK